jgi:hypothetical protein
MFWDIFPCGRVKIYPRFTGTEELYPQGQRLSQKEARKKD